MLTVVASEFRMYVLGSEARDERPSFSVKKKAPKINGKPWSDWLHEMSAFWKLGFAKT